MRLVSRACVSQRGYGTPVAIERGRRVTAVTWAPAESTVLVLLGSTAAPSLEENGPL